MNPVSAPYVLVAPPKLTPSEYVPLDVAPPFKLADIQVAVIGNVVVPAEVLAFVASAPLRYFKMCTLIIGVVVGVVVPPPPPVEVAS